MTLRLKAPPECLDSYHLSKALAVDYGREAWVPHVEFILTRHA